MKFIVSGFSVTALCMCAAFAIGQGTFDRTLPVSAPEAFQVSFGQLYYISESWLKALHPARTLRLIGKTYGDQPRVLAETPIL